MTATESRPLLQRSAEADLAEMKDRVALLDEDWFPDNNDGQDRNRTVNPYSFSSRQHTDDATPDTIHVWKANDQSFLQPLNPSSRELFQETRIAGPESESPITPTQNTHTRKLDENGNLTPLPAATPPLYALSADSGSDCQDQDEIPLPLTGEADVVPIPAEISASESIKAPPLPHTAVMNFRNASTAKETPRRPYRVSKLLKATEAKNAAKAAVGDEGIVPHVRSVKSETTDIVREAMRDANFGDGQDDNNLEDGADDGMTSGNRSQVSDRGVKNGVFDTQSATQGYDALQSKECPRPSEEGDTEAQPLSEDLVEHTMDSCRRKQQSDHGLESDASETDSFSMKRYEVGSGGDTEDLKGGLISSQAPSNDSGDSVKLDNIKGDGDNHEMFSDGVAPGEDIDGTKKDDGEAQEKASDGTDTEVPDTNEEAISGKDVESKECPIIMGEDINTKDHGQNMVESIILVEGNDKQDKPRDGSEAGTSSTDDMSEQCVGVKNEDTDVQDLGGDLVEDTLVGGIDRIEADADDPGIVYLGFDDIINAYDTIHSYESLDSDYDNLRASQPGDDIADHEEMPVPAAESNGGPEISRGTTKAAQSSESLVDKDETHVATVMDAHDTIQSEESFGPRNGNTEAPQTSQFIVDSKVTPTSTVKNVEEPEIDRGIMSAQKPGEAGAGTEKVPEVGDEFGIGIEAGEARYSKKPITDEVGKSCYAAKSHGSSDIENDGVRPVPETEAVDQEASLGHEAAHFVQQPSASIKEHEPTAGSPSFDVRTEEKEFQFPEDFNVREEEEQGFPVYDHASLIASMTSGHGVTASDESFNLEEWETEMQQSGQIDADELDKSGDGAKAIGCATDDIADRREINESESSAGFWSEDTETQHAKHVTTSKLKPGAEAEDNMSAGDEPTQTDLGNNMPKKNAMSEVDEEINDDADSDLEDKKMGSQHPMTVDNAVAHEAVPVRRFISKGLTMYLDVKGDSEQGDATVEDQKLQEGEVQDTVRGPEQTFIERGLALLLHAMSASLGI